MNDFFDKAKNLGAKAYGQAGDVLEISKYKAKIVSKKSEIEKLQQEIGEYVYEQYTDEGIRENFNSEIIEKCKSIDGVTDEIMMLEEKIEAIKKD